MQPFQMFLKHREQIVILLFSLIIVGYIAFLLVSNYQSQVKLRTSTLERIVHDVDKRTASVSYFFSERKNDLKSLVASQEISTFFENQALGMSMEYGLRTSSMAISKRLQQFIIDKTVGGESIYFSALLVDHLGNPIATSQALDTRHDTKNNWKSWLTPKNREERIIVMGSKIFLSVPYFFNTLYAGQVLTRVIPQSVYDHLVKMDESQGQYIGIVSGRDNYFAPEDLPAEILNWGLPELRMATDDSQYKFQLTPHDGIKTEMMVIRKRVINTPFSIVSILSTASVFGPNTPRQLLITLAALSIVFIGGSVLVWRMYIQKLVLRTKLVETAEKEKAIAETNQALKKENQERRQVEAALKKNEEKYRLLVENQTDMVIKMNLENRILFISPSYCRMFDKKEEDLLEQEFMPLVHEEDRETTAREMKKLYQPPYTAYIEQRAMTKDGWKWFGWMNTAVLDGNGNIKEIIGVGRDITSSKQAEKEKFEAQRIAAKHENYAIVGKISGKMAHDFNNILGIIMGNSELALLDCSDSQIKDTLQLILQQTLRGKNLTKNLVAFAKDMEPKQKFFRINDKIELVLNLMKKDTENIRIIREDGPNLPDLLADPGMLEHALVNIIQNSIHAVSRIEEPVIMIKAYRHENDICLEIEDNGCGIPEKHLGDIYDSSFSLKGSNDLTGSYDSRIKGSGYGLANVKKYIALHKGDILVSSKPDSGTKIILCLPIIERELTQKEKIDVQDQISHYEKYILLIEDETAISDVQYRVLTQAPCLHKVDTANNGKAAMDLSDRNTYDLVSLDYQLPGDINGMDVYHHIRKTNKAIPILFISGNVEFLESIKKLKQKDAFLDHLSKPCQNKDYVNTINKLIEHNLSDHI